ncbi:tubulin-like doman-containing protein [Geminocystis herdmanii]|uniref:tubulin-like doman-containing protein n=1 Tax=Geminocystis herdmanii TaxID=669359 RepID=UPI002351ECDB|nr:tubulin-like doman-containing protein [Geminocystis herdmanii]
MKVGNRLRATGKSFLVTSNYSLCEYNKIIGYFVMTPELYGNNAGVRANTYAALKELDYYSSPKRRFKQNYDAQGIVSIDESRPPFDYCYLVGDRTFNDHRILNKNKLSQIIAYKIFADFAEDKEIIAGLKRNRKNFDLPITLFDEHPRSNVQNYLTFGLSKIYFPRDLTIAICLNKVKMKLINFWLYGDGQSPDSVELLDKFLLNWQSKNETNPNIFKAKLESVTQENDKTFKQVLNNWLSKNKTEIDNCNNADDRQRFIDKIRSEIKSQFKKVQLGETENIRGVWLTQLQKNSIKLEKQFTQDILDYFANLLEPSNPTFALDNTRGWLEALLTKLNEYVRELEEEKEKGMAFVTLENIDKKWQDSCQRFDDIETDKKGFLGIGGKSNKTKNQEFEREANQSIQDIDKLIQRNFDLTLTEESLKIVTNLRQLVINLKTKASNFYNLLQDIESFYKRKGEDLSQIDDDEINGEAIFEPEDNDQYYQVLLPESEKRNLFVEVSNKINETATLPSSLLYFFTAERAIDERELSEIIDDNIEGKFGNKTIDLTESVVNRFMQKYPFSSGEIRLQQIIDEGDFLLPLNLSEPYLINNFAPSKNESPRVEPIIAFKGTDERENKQFQELITQKLGFPSDRVIPLIQSKNEIIIIQEIAAFPLRIINGLQTLKSQYEQQKSSLNGYSLHNDYTKNFLDIIPPPAREMEQLQDLFYTCLGFGKITKNIPVTHKKYKKIKPADSHYTAIVLKTENELTGENYELELSQNWSEALEQISQNKALVEHLEDIKEELIYDIQTQPELWTSYDLKFKSFARKVSQMKESDDNFPEKDLLLGKPANLNSRPKEGILTRIYKQFMTILEEIKTELDQELEFDQNNETNFVDAEIDNSDNYININVEEVDREFYEKWKNITPLELLEMKKEGILSTEEVNKIKKYVLGL